MLLSPYILPSPSSPHPLAHPHVRKSVLYVNYCCLENSIDRGAWRATSPWGHEELDITEHACRTKSSEPGSEEREQKSFKILKQVELERCSNMTIAASCLGVEGSRTVLKGKLALK